MKKLSALACLCAVFVLFLLAFRTLAPKSTTIGARAATPISCAPFASSTINAVPFDIAKYSPQTTMVRRNISTWSQSEYEDLKRAIVAMRALPYTDPTSWQYQAAIHGTTMRDNLPLWNSCQHGTRFFYSWHRMYMYFVERIMRAKSGNPSFTLPYWDYQTSPTIPAPYRDNTSGNPLYDGTRFASVNGGGALPSSISTSINNALNFISFYDFQTRIEGPHGSVHTSIGGNMGQINTAGVDPVFYLHHTNIDRLWEVWLWRCQGRVNPTASDETWWNQRFTFFDENGQAVVMTGNQIVDAATQLNYSYDNPPAFTSTTTSTPIPSPGRFEAENYNAMLGITTIRSNDGGDGRSVTSISNGDWMDYTVNIPAAGTYRMNFRVATGKTPDRSLQVRNASGTILTTVTVPFTGSHETYTTTSTNVALPAGTQTLRIHASYGGWNFNWFEIISQDSTTTTTSPCATTTSRLIDYSTLKKTSHELLQLQKITRLNQQVNHLPLADAKTEGIKAFLNKTNNSQLKVSQRAQDDKLFAEVELLKLNKAPEGIVEVYLNLPNGTTPTPNSIYYADVLNLFGASEHIHHNDKGGNMVFVDLSTAAAAQGLSIADLAKAKLTFFVRSNRLANGQDVKTSFDAQVGTIKIKVQKAEK